LSPSVGGSDGDYHHHHQAPSGGAPGQGNDIRQGQVFHGYPTSYPSNNVGGAAMAPSIQDGIDHMGSSTNATAVATSKSPPASNISLFGDLPDHKRRKFILVDDPHRGARVRVRVMLDQVEMKEIPDSYRKTNSVFPRSYFATQMQSPPSSARGSRFFDDDNDDANDVSGTRRGRTMVQVPMLDGTEVESLLQRLTG
jgi:hypothetical protein